MFFRMMCVRTKAEMVALNKMTPAMAEWVFSRVKPMQHDRDGRPEYLDADVDAAIKEYWRAIRPDHPFYEDRARDVPMPKPAKERPVGTKYVGGRIGCTQAHVRNLIKKHRSLRRTMVPGQGARERKKFVTSKVDQWIENYLRDTDD